LTRARVRAGLVIGFEACASSDRRFHRALTCWTAACFAYTSLPTFRVQTVQQVVLLDFGSFTEKARIKKGDEMPSG
jgi:hypothetical protein